MSSQDLNNAVKQAVDVKNLRDWNSLFGPFGILQFNCRGPWYGRQPPDINTALKIAVAKKNLQKVKNLLSAGANVHTEVWFGGEDIGSLLHHCSDAPIVRELLLNGISVNRTNDKGETPLYRACGGRGAFTEVVKELLKAGAWVNYGDPKGNTPLHEAVRSSCGYFGTIKVLLEYGADINQKNRDMWRYGSPLDDATDSLPLAKFLIKMFLIQNFRKNIKKINLEPYMHERKLHSKLVECFDNCVSEIVQMKTEMVNQQTSLYELITKKTINLHLSDNNEWVKKIKGIMTERYPYYHEIIAEKIESGIVRWKLLNKLRDLNLFTRVLETSEEKQTIVLDPGSVHNIAKYLSMTDLSNLVIALSSNSIPKVTSNSDGQASSHHVKRRKYYS